MGQNYTHRWSVFFLFFSKVPLTFICNNQKWDKKKDKKGSYNSLIKKKKKSWDF